LKLAQIHYQVRILELRELILAEELKFKRVLISDICAAFLNNSSYRAILAEIDEIQAGLWDDKIRADLGISSPAEPVSRHSSAPKVNLSLCWHGSLFDILFAQESPVELPETGDVSMVEAEGSPDEVTLPTPSVLSHPITPVDDETNESPMDQSIDAIPQGIHLQSTQEIEQPKIDQPEDTGKIQEQDLEEDEVSFQLAHAPSSPALSETVPIASRSLVPMYPDRESSPPDEVEGHVKTIPDAQSIKTPIPDSPQSIEELTPEAEDDLEEGNVSEPQEEPISREYLVKFFRMLQILITFQVRVLSSLYR
jgi:bromodomain-containing protein 8